MHIENQRRRMIRRAWLSVPVLFVLILARSHGAESVQTTTPPDAIFYNGHFITVGTSLPTAQAVAVSNGKFAAVGSNDAVQRMAGPSTRRVDLQGRTVVPGLEDDHFHSIGGGPGVDLSRTRTIQDVLNAIREGAAKASPGEVIVTNSDWHEGQLKEQRLPYRKELDQAAPHHPLVVVRGGHEYILNSAALEKWKITTATSEPEGGSIGRYSDGTLNGELVDRAKNLVSLPPPPRRDLETSIKDQIDEFRRLNEAGLTSIRYPGTSIEAWRLLQEMKRRGVLTMRTNVLFRLGNSPANIPADLDRLGIGPDEGDDWIRAGGIKLIVDGGFEGGWMRDPYEEPWGKHGTYRGLQTFPSEPYKQIVRILNQRGWRVATHAVGDAAIDLVLDAYEAADRESSIAGKRWSIEHGFIPRPEHFARMKKLGIVLSAQNHLYLAAPSLKAYWGEKRTAWMTPLRAYIDAGIPIASGTDSAVVPYPPLWTMYHFITRNTISGGVVGPDQRITRQEALRAATLGNAYLTFEENTKGSIESGKLADFVVLAEDILTCPEKDIENMKVMMTVIGGKVVFDGAKGL
jgi:predicted amidohydrolase YtcJ